MKRTIALLIISTLFTGCAQVGQAVQRRLTPSIDLAKQDCIEMGFSVGSPQYQNCVMVTTNNIRNAREQQSRDSEAVRQSVDVKFKTTQCRQVGAFVQCQEW